MGQFQAKSYKWALAQQLFNLIGVSMATSQKVLKYNKLWFKKKKKTTMKKILLPTNVNVKEQNICEQLVHGVLLFSFCKRKFCVFIPSVCSFKSFLVKKWQIDFWSTTKYSIESKI